jgi:hypothetical protein
LEISTENNLTSLGIEKCIFQSLAYFDIFNYPLKVDEIQQYCPKKLKTEELKYFLDQLLEENKVKEQSGFYFLNSAEQACIEARLNKEKFLLAKSKKIKRYAKLVSKFPFVESAFISGSVSKGLLDKDGDVDYFIIAKANRVWLCRSILIAFKKIVLLNSKKYFCVNYFIDTNNLLVPDQNLFVATELTSLQPIDNKELNHDFYNKNKWIKEFFPNNVSQKNSLFREKIKKGPLSKLAEMICSGSIGEKLDNYFFKMTLDRWQKKFPQFSKNEFDLNMRSYKSISKHHPKGYQKIVLEALSFRMNKYGNN